MDSLFDVGEEKCKMCSYFCEKCNNTANNCTTCPINSNRINIPYDKCPCKSRYFNVGK